MSVDLPATEIAPSMFFEAIKNLQELRDLGVIQEVNRLLLHPMGLALGVFYEAGEEPSLVMFDSREDAKGIRYEDDVLEPEKAQTFARLLKAGVENRLPTFGYGVQPVDGLPQVQVSLVEVVTAEGFSPEDAEEHLHSNGHWDARSGH